MKKEVAIASFKFTYAHLKQLCDNALNLIARDTAEFADRGYTATRRATFAQLLSTFVAVPDEETMLARREQATKNKNTQRDLLETKMRTYFLAAKNTYGESTPKYHEFGNAFISQQTDDELVRTAKIMSRALTDNITALANEGITTAKITAFDQLRQAYDDSIDTQARAISAKDVTAEERLTAANNLYAELVKVCDLGKDIWYTTNEAKYNDYVIYNTTTGLPDAPPTDTPSM